MSKRGMEVEFRHRRVDFYQRSTNNAGEVRARSTEFKNCEAIFKTVKMAPLPDQYRRRLSSGRRFELSRYVVWWALFSCFHPFAGNRSCVFTGIELPV